jgi:hypothetical protein
VARVEFKGDTGDVSAERRVGLGPHPEERRTKPPSRNPRHAYPGAGLARGIWRFRVARVARVTCISRVNCITRIRHVIIAVARVGLPVGVLVALVGVLASIDIDNRSIAARESDEQDSKHLLRSHGRRAYRKTGR